MNPWRSRLSRWFTPIARRTPLSPNAITLIALTLNVIAALCFARGATRPALFLVAIVFIAVGGLADAFDGIVARAQKKSSRFGDFLDHCADRVSDGLLAACWAYGNNVREPLVIAVTLLVMLNGYIGTQIEATFHERNYDTVGRGEFVLALIVFPTVSYILFDNGWDGLRLATLTIPEWMSVALVVFGVVGIVQRIVVAARLERS